MANTNCQCSSARLPLLAEPACLGKPVLLCSRPVAPRRKPRAHPPPPPKARATRQTNRFALASQSVRKKSGQFLQDDWLRGCAGRRASLLISCTARPEPLPKVSGEASFLSPRASLSGAGDERHPMSIKNSLSLLLVASMLLSATGAESGGGTTQGNLQQKLDAFEKKLEGMRNLPAGAASAKMQLSNLMKMGKGAPAPLEQYVLEAVCAGLVSIDANDLYEKIRPTLPDVSSFENEVLETCPACSGSGGSSIPCQQCHGSGDCPIPSCENGTRETPSLGGSPGMVVSCSTCKGTGKCPACQGKGEHIVRCSKCHGTRRIVNKTAARKLYENRVTMAIADCRDKQGKGVLPVSNLASNKSLQHEVIPSQGGRERSSAPENIQAIFEKAKTAAAESNKLNMCGFYTGMSAADAQTLTKHYALGVADGITVGDPVYMIVLSPGGLRRVTRGGNTFDELVQAVENRVGNLKQDRDSKEYKLKTIDGIVVTMSESVGFNMTDPVVKEYSTKEYVARRAEREASERSAFAEAFSKRKESTLPDLIASMVKIPGKDYSMGKYEVTQAQWELVMGDNPSRFKGVDNPVESISWDDCQKFLENLNSLPIVKQSGLVFRLPTAEEWEYACRADATGMYCKLVDGTEITENTLDRVAWFSSNWDPKTHPVGQKEPNAYGLYDMHGNVSEWTQTADGEDRVNLGGSYITSAKFCEASFQSRILHSSQNSHLGFRLCAIRKETAKMEDNERRALDALFAARRASAIPDLIANMVKIPDKGYMMGKYEVTQAQWEAIMNENPSHFKGADNPVEMVSWYECQTFLRKLNDQPAVKKSGLEFRLPTNAEWEYACRAGSIGKYCKLVNEEEITEDTLGRVAWFRDNSDRQTHPVGQKEPNAFGLYDMNGNVWEWCQEEYGSIESSAKGQHNEHDRIYHGGCWLLSAKICEASFRGGFSPSHQNSRLGFRLCASRR